jgi:hypothetical protein
MTLSEFIKTQEELDFELNEWGLWEIKLKTAKRYYILYNENGNKGMVCNIGGFLSEGQSPEERALTVDTLNLMMKELGVILWKC